MTTTLPQTKAQIKTVSNERVPLPPPDLTNSDIGAAEIIFRFSLCGNSDIEIIADESDDEEALRQRLTIARPTLEVLRRMFIVNPLTGQEIQ